MSEEACDACGDDVSDALARTVRLSVDRSQIDAQRLCPACFAEWIDRYQAEMQPDADTADVADADSDTEIIVD
ncbi:MAG: hypothetical protein ABEJ22_09680 [Haloferacaceae archaeon]